jgi:hypothetical protein
MLCSVSGCKHTVFGRCWSPRPCCWAHAFFAAAPAWWCFDNAMYTQKLVTTGKQHHLAIMLTMQSSSLQLPPPHLMASSRASRSCLSSGVMPFQHAPAAAIDFTPCTTQAQQQHRQQQPQEQQ